VIESLSVAQLIFLENFKEQKERFQLITRSLGPPSQCMQLSQPGQITDIGAQMGF
jgi:hypothetical protein